MTGARVKLGYQTALKFLRNGALVIATTRFPRNAARRYASEPDFPAWKDRLRIHAMDQRNLPAVHAFAEHLCGSLEGLDILINNAAQTIRRPREFYLPLLALESRPIDALPPAEQALLTSPTRAIETVSGDIAALVATRDTALATTSSWQLAMEDVQPLELAEVMVVNAMAPFILCSRLEPLLRRSRFADRYIVNVTSAEGQFGGDKKLPNHPHTNMAKAALNMLTRTAADRCAADGIYMNSVDPGWITNMQALDPASPDDAMPGAGDTLPPLDAVDGAARIYDPIIRGVEGKPVFGLLLKNYDPAPW